MLKLSAAIIDFLAHCRIEKKLSSKTLKAYKTDLLQLNRFLIENKYSENVMEINKVYLRGYIDAMSDLKPKSIKRKLASSKALFNYLEYEDHIQINPFRKMRIKINEPTQLPKVMNINEITKIFQIAYRREQLFKQQNKPSYGPVLTKVVVIELLFATGGRVSEIANLKAESVNLESGVITIKGKGNKERIIQICNPDSLKILKHYSKIYEEQIEKEGFFLINRLNKKISDQSIRIMVKNLANIANLPRNITPHVFRHSFATLLLEQDVDIKYIQSMLGHSSITTTQIYTHVNKEKQRQILLNKHPRKNIELV